MSKKKDITNKYLYFISIKKDDDDILIGKALNMEHYHVILMGSSTRILDKEKCRISNDKNFSWFVNGKWEVFSDYAVCKPCDVDFEFLSNMFIETFSV